MAKSRLQEAAKKYIKIEIEQTTFLDSIQNIIASRVRELRLKSISYTQGLIDIKKELGIKSFEKLDSLDSILLVTHQIIETFNKNTKALESYNNTLHEIYKSCRVPTIYPKEDYKRIINDLSREVSQLLEENKQCVTLDQINKFNKAYTFQITSLAEIDELPWKIQKLETAQKKQNPVPLQKPVQPLSPKLTEEVDKKQIPISQRHYEAVKWEFEMQIKSAKTSFDTLRIQNELDQKKELFTPESFLEIKQKLKTKRIALGVVSPEKTGEIKAQYKDTRSLVSVFFSETLQQIKLKFSNNDSNQPKFRRK